MATPRKRLSMCTKHMTKKEKIDKQQAEKRLKVARDQLKPPDFLPDIAKEEFCRLVQEAAGADFLDNLDLSILAIYADNWAKYIRASEAIQREGLTYETDKGNIFPSPYVNIADKAAAMIMRCSSKLGLATTDRLKLIIPDKEEKPANKFIKLLDA